VRLGFNMLSGMSSAHVERIEEARRAGPFRSLEDFARRTGLSRAVLTRLAKAGVFGSLGLGRRDSLWHALAQGKKALPLFDRAVCETDQEHRVCETHQDVALNDASVHFTHPTGLPQMSPAEEVLADYRTMGLSLRAHPLSFLRKNLDALGVTPARQLKTCDDRGAICVAGIVLVRQRPGTAKGITFVTLEDETGTANLIIRPAVWKRYRSAAAGATLMLAYGRLQRQAEVIHVLTTKLEDFSQRLRELGSQSRDFC
jgi:error-prone DNA polymerase